MTPRHLALPLALFACSHLVACSEDGGLSSPDASAPPDAGVSADASVSSDAGAAPDASGFAFPTEIIGRFVPSRVAAVLHDDAHHRALLGTVGAVVSPYVLGESDDPSAPDELRAGLVVLDTATGEAHAFGREAGLPEQSYTDQQIDFGVGPAPLFSLAWIEPGSVFAGAAWGHVVRGTIDANGAVEMTSAAIRRDGAAADAFVSSVAFSAGELFVGTDQGFAALDPATLAAKRWYDVGAGAEWARGVFSVRLPDDRVLGLAGPVESQEADTIVVLTPGSTEATRVALPEGGVAAFDVVGFDGRALVAGRITDGRGVVWTLGLARGGQWVMDEAIAPYALTGVDQPPYVPHAMAYDAVHGRLLLGGAITVLAPLRTGGLLEVPIEGDGSIAGDPAPLFDRRDPYASMLPWEVSLLEVDEAGRAWFMGYDLCSEHKRGVVGLLRLERDGDEKRLVRPLVSGVRAMAEGPGGELWLGLRDELPGLRCDGLAIAQHVCRLKADGSCEVYGPYVTANADRFAAAPGVVSIAFGDPAAHEQAFATIRDATFLRRGDVTHAVPTQFEPGVSLDMTKVAWGANGELWAASKLAWFQFPDDTPEQAAAVNRRSPQGLGFLQLDASGDVRVMRRYTREASELMREHEELGGLPSGTVLDLLVLDGRARALVATGIERWDAPYDHLNGDLAPSNVRGGVALIEDRDIHVFTATGGLELGDVVALAEHGGAYYALDADLGLFELDLVSHTAARIVAAPWAAPERGRVLAIDGSGRVVVGTTREVWIGALDGGLQALRAGGGFVWSLHVAADGVVYAGTDRGLYRVRLSSAELPARGPSGVLAREPWPLPLGCYGERGCACYDEDQCAAGLACNCPNGDPSSCLCQGGGVTCDTPPLADTCACTVDRDCQSGHCDCTGASCVCAPPVRDCTTMTCPCSADSDCPSGWHCQGGFAGFSCAQ